MGNRGRKRKVSDEKARNFYLLYLSVKNKIRLVSYKSFSCRFLR